MTLLRRLTRLAVLAGVTLLATTGAIGIADTAHAVDRPAKSFSLSMLDTVATVNADGSMDVTEKITYEFSGGPFNFGIRSFSGRSLGQITTFAVKDGAGTELETIPPSRSVSGSWEWRLGGISDVTETYTIAYHVDYAIGSAGPTAELYWQFLGRDHDGVGRVTVRIDLPTAFPVAAPDSAPTDTSLLRAWGHGPRQGTVDVQADHVTLDVTGVGSGQFVEARLVMPSATFTSLMPTGTALARVLEEEGSAIDATLREDAAAGQPKQYPHAGLGNLLILLGSLGGFIAMGISWLMFGREPKPDPMIGDYWREPLEDSPGVVLANLAKSKPALGPLLTSTLIDLAQRGYLSIREERVERMGPDKVTHHLILTPKPQTDLAEFERLVMENVFQGRSEVTTDEITDWARKNRYAAQTFTKKTIAAVQAEYDSKKYRVNAKGGAAGAAFVVAAIPAITGLIAWRLGSRPYIISLIAAGIAAVATTALVVNRSQAGADAAARAEALKRYLKDFSNLEEAPAGHLILWERFLVYAVTLGVAKELIDGMRVVVPNVADDPNFGAWYWGAAGGYRFVHFAAFTQDFSHSAGMAYKPPSQSGSSGGFSSSGGGGGGGGGGFGAR